MDRPRCHLQEQGIPDTKKSATTNHIPSPHLAFKSVSGSSEFLGHEPPVLLARPCSKTFSAPNSNVSVCLASLCIGHKNLCLVTLGGELKRAHCLPQIYLHPLTTFRLGALSFTLTCSNSLQIFDTNLQALVSVAVIYINILCVCVCVCVCVCINI